MTLYKTTVLIYLSISKDNNDNSNNALALLGRQETCRDTAVDAPVFMREFLEGSFVSAICIYCLMAKIKGLLHFFRKDFNMTFCHWHSIWTININRRSNNLLHKFVAAKQQQSNVGLPVIFITFIKIKILYDKKTMLCCRILL